MIPSPLATTTLPDGGLKTVYSDGSTRIAYSDGRRRYMLPGLLRATEDRDGSITVFYQGGDTYFQDANRNLFYVRQDGSRIPKRSLPYGCIIVKGDDFLYFSNPKPAVFHRLRARSPAPAPYRLTVVPSFRPKRGFSWPWAIAIATSLFSLALILSR